MRPTLYYWNTPNGHKPVILLEELGIQYEVKPVDIGRGEQFAPDFLKISPNNKIPALQDIDATGMPFAMFESGAILMHLADKHGRFLPASGAARMRVLQWLFWQVGGLGPMAGQNHHFVKYAPQSVPYAIDRYVGETTRLYRVLDQALEGNAWVAGAYSIADMAIYPWIAEHALQRQNLDDTPNVSRWLSAMQSRPAVQRAYYLAEQWLGSTRATFDAQAMSCLFGLKTQPS